MRNVYSIFVLGMIAIAGSASAQSTKSFQLPVNNPWFDTGISLSVGQNLTISASGSVYVGALNPSSLDYQTPAGSPGVTPQDMHAVIPFLGPSLTLWSLIGRIGSAGAPFEVGDNSTFAVDTAGELYLSINDNVFGDNSGSWSVTIKLSPPPPTLTSPINGGTAVPSGLTFSWNSSSGATSYALQVSSDPNFLNIDTNVSNLTNTSFSLKGIPPFTYYWRVNASNAVGTSSWSSVWSFKVAGGVPQLPSIGDIQSVRGVKNTISLSELNATSSFQANIPMLNPFTIQQNFWIFNPDPSSRYGKKTWYVQNVLLMGTSDSPLLLFQTVISWEYSVYLFDDATRTYTLFEHGQGLTVPHSLLNQNWTLVSELTPKGVRLQWYIGDSQIVDKPVPLLVTQRSYINWYDSQYPYQDYTVPNLVLVGPENGAPVSFSNPTQGTGTKGFIQCWVDKRGTWTNSLFVDGVLEGGGGTLETSTGLYWTGGLSSSAWSTQIAETSEPFSYPGDPSTEFEGVYFRLPFGLPSGLPLAAGGKQQMPDAGNRAPGKVSSAQLSTAEKGEITGPSTFELYQNYPNPSNPTTVITYDIARPSFVTLKVYDVLGRQVETLLNAYKSPGEYQAIFNGSQLPSGVYFYRLEAGSFTQVKRLMLIK